MSKYNPNLHIERLKAIRPFVNFNYSINDIKKNNISHYDKKKIKDYYDELKELTYQRRYKAKFKNPQRKAIARAASGQSNKRGFKYTLIETDETGKKPKISFSNDNKTLYIEYKGVKKTFIPFNKNNLALDHRAEAERAIKNLPTGTKKVSPQLGAFESIKYVLEPKDLPDLIDKWMMKYKDKKPNEWINGINALTPKNQKSLDDYRNAKAKSRAAQSKKNKAARKKAYDAKRKKK